MGQGTSPRLAVSLVALVVGGALAACQGGASGARDLFSGNPDPGRPYQSPDAVSGGTRGGGRPAAPDPVAMKSEEDAAAAKARAEAEAAKAAQARAADALWAKAEAERDPEDAGDDYRKLATDHKDSPRAEEARWRSAVKYFEAAEWSQCLAALDAYTKDFPVNPHLADAERMTYDAALKHYEAAHAGLGKIFKSDQAAFDALASIVDRFPQGQYPDDALLTLGELYRRKEDYAVAALQYRNLLIRYPDSEWSFQARLRLGDVYLARDQGSPYHAGYVDLDPREPTNPAASASRPVRSCVEAALAEYEAFLERIAADPARRAEYASDVAYAQERVADCRRRLAEKDRAIAGFYGARGQAAAADAYQRFAGNVEGGRTWSDGLTAPPAPRTVPTPPPAISPGTVPPGTAAPRVVAPPPVAPRPVPPPTVVPPTVVPPITPPPVAPPPKPAPVIVPPMPAPPPPPPPRVLPPTVTVSPALTPAPTPAPTPGALPPPRRSSRDASTPTP